jgi:signal transduction histidine kinase/DNA-binding response OmpR family regulator
MFKYQMQLKTKLFLFVFGLSVFGSALIGIVTYNSAVESEYQGEIEATRDLAHHLARMLEEEKDLGEIKEKISMFNDAHFATYLLDTEQNVYPSDNKIAIPDSIITNFLKESLRSNHYYGYRGDIDTDEVGEASEVGIAWYITGLKGSSYSLALVRQCDESEEFKELFEIFGLPFIASGLVIFVLAFLGSLLLGSLIKKLDDQKIWLEVQAGELKDAKNKAQLASSAKSRFLANISHEIRTPLTAIIGFSEVLMRHSLSKEHEEESIGTIHRTSKHLLNLINETLDFSKIEANKLEVEHLRFSPLKMLLDIELLVTPQAVEKDLSFEVHYNFPLPTEIKSDPFRLKQILCNLYSNALKFTESGSITLNVSCDMGAQLMKFEMVDTGIGIGEENIAKIFEDFSQADTTISRRYGGTGLGLSLSKKLAEILGGTIVVESILGEGSRFILTIATDSLDNAEVIHGTNDLPEITNQSCIQIPNLSGRVLVAEDNEDNWRLISLLVQKAGIKVEWATNGQDAVEKAVDKQVDLVLMDMQMPIMDGLTATRILREQNFDKPIIALTANVMGDDRDKCRSNGCDDFLGKPIESAKLYDVLSKYLVEGPQSNITQKLNLRTDKRNNIENGTIVSQLSGDPDFSEIIEVFIRNLQNMQASINTALRSSDWVELKNLFHQLKGSGGGAGFPQISDVAGIILGLIRDQDYGQIESEIASFELVCEQIYAGVNTDDRELGISIS